jgi:lysophospholipase L1-like esterase
VQQVKAAKSLPFLATLPPTKLGADERASEERNAWVDRINARIRELAHAEGAVLVDVHARLAADAAPPGLFADGLHPNDAGYEAIAQAFFEAITRRAADR